MEKPNLERVSLSTFTNSGWGFFPKRRLNKYWDDILSGKIEYHDDDAFSTLLSKNHLESFYDDLLFLGKIIFPKYIDAEEKAKSQISDLYEFNHELLGAISFLKKNAGKVGIKMYYNKHEFIISHNEIVDIFENSLLKYIKKNRKSLFYAYPSGLSIDSITEKSRETKDLFSKQKGRQHKSIQTKFMVYCLWNYLNENTNLSVKNSPDISERQIALFIYEYLLVFSFIEKLAKPADSILNYLKNITKLLGEI